MSNIDHDGRSIPELFSDAFAQLAKLVQNEISLARAEITDKASQAATGVGFVFAGLMLMVPALVLFGIALAIYLTQIGLSPVIAHLLSGGIAVVASGALIFAGLGRLKPASLAPQVTLQQVEKDVAAAKEIVR